METKTSERASIEITTYSKCAQNLIAIFTTIHDSSYSDNLETKYSLFIWTMTENGTNEFHLSRKVTDKSFIYRESSIKTTNPNASPVFVVFGFSLLLANEFV